MALSGFIRPAVSVFHNGVTLTSADSTPFPGTLLHGYAAYGGTAGIRLLWGSEWRITAGAELGWTRRLYSALQQINTRVSPSVDYHLGLADLALAPSPWRPWVASSGSSPTPCPCPSSRAWSCSPAASWPSP